jgi:hypothetical protein
VSLPRRTSTPAANGSANNNLERLTKCLCIQTAFFPLCFVVGDKIVLETAFSYTCGNFAPAALHGGKTLVFGAEFILLEAPNRTDYEKKFCYIIFDFVFSDFITGGKG